MSISPTEIFTQALTQVNQSLQDEQVVRVGFELKDGL